MGGNIYTHMFIKYFKNIFLYILFFNDKLCVYSFQVINIFHV